MDADPLVVAAVFWEDEAGWMTCRFLKLCVNLRSCEQRCRRLNVYAGILDYIHQYSVGSPQTSGRHH
jgi:hypothetical protein